jgi:hypothetical protein
MPTKYNLNPVLKRIIQDFEDSIRKLCFIDPEADPGYEELAQEQYQEAKTNLIDLIGEMDEQINGKIKIVDWYKKKDSPAAKKRKKKVKR